MSRVGLPADGRPPEGAKPPDPKPARSRGTAVRGPDAFSHRNDAVLLDPASPFESPLLGAAAPAAGLNTTVDAAMRALWDRERSGGEDDLSAEAVGGEGRRLIRPGPFLGISDGQPGGAEWSETREVRKKKGAADLKWMDFSD